MHGHVRLQITLLGECLAAYVTFERLLIAMGKFVLCQPTSAAKLQPAQSALVLVQPIQPLLVVDQPVLVVEPAIADHALNRLVLTAFDLRFLLVDLMGF